MKLHGSVLLLPVGLALLCPADGTEKPKLSEHLKKEVISKLPAYVLKQHSEPTEFALQSEINSDLLVLPKMVVREKRLPGNDPDVWLSDSVVQRKAMVAYKTSMTDFEWALNGWYIPLVAAPPSVRAKDAYRSAKVSAEMGRLMNVIEAVEKIDPRDAARLKRELTRPADSLPTPNP